MADEMTVTTPTEETTGVPGMLEPTQDSIYDTDGNVLENPDMSLGHVEYEQRVKVHHEAVPAQEEKFEWHVLPGTEKLHPGGLRQKVITQKATPAREAWDEYESIRVYHPYTEEELAEINKPSLEDRVTAVEEAVLEMMLV